MIVLSKLYRVWAGVGFCDFLGWQDGSVADELFDGIDELFDGMPGKEAIQASLDLALAIEACILDGTPLVGALLD